MTITINGTTGITNDGGYTGDGVVFADTTPANTLVTTTGGNVGMGTSSPATKADVAGTIRTTSGSDYGTFTCLYDGNLASYEIAFRTGLNNARTERARIDSSGDFLVGTPTNPSGYKMAVKQTGYDAMYVECGISPGGHAIFATRNADGDLIMLARNGVVKGTISVNTTSVAYNTTSDYRLKEAIAPMTGALDRVSQLKPVTYKWKVDGSDGQGFIAHELQEVEPGCVTGEKDAVDAEGNPVYQGIDTSFLVATLTAAIQEQQQLITALTARVAALEGK